MRLIKKILVLVFVVVVLYSCGDRSVYHVLLVQSYESTYSLYPHILKTAKKAFKKNGLKVEITSFYLDCNRYDSREEVDRICNFLDSTQHLSPDIIVVNDDQATYSLLKSNHPLLRSLPIVFFGVNYPNWKLLARYNNVTGKWDRPDFVHTIRMIESLMGKGYVSYSSDTTTQGRAVDKEMLNQIMGTDILLRKKISLLDSNDSLHSPNSIIEKKMDSTVVVPINIQELQGQQMLMFLSGLMKDRATILTKRDHSTLLISQMLFSYPIFTVLNEGFGSSVNRIIGGYITPLDESIYETAGIVSKILKGESVYKFPVTESAKKYMVDWNELKRWNIDITAIPKEWEIVNIPFAEKYRLAVIIGAALIVLLIVMAIFSMTYLWKKERRRKLAVLLDLRREQEFLSMALKGGNIYMWWYDLNYGTFSFDNDFYETQKLEKRKYDEHFFKDHIHPDDLKNVEFILRKYIEKGGYRETSQFRLCLSGETYEWWEFRLYPSMVTINETQFIMGLCLNIQEFKNREEELIKARDLAAQAELKESFLANISHEIRTPLNSIVGFSTLLAENEYLSESEKLKYIDVINKNCKTLLNLINDILEISRLESGNMTFSMDYCNMTELVNDLCESTNFLIPAGVVLEKELPAEELDIYTDRMRLTQVIANFINNAVKFTDRGYIKVGYTVSYIHDPVTAGRKPRELQIYVEDTGKGISKDVQKIIFSRFYKQDEFAQGTGLGLSICNVIVKRLDGYITLDSEVGKGSRFTVHIPLKENCRLVREGESSEMKNPVPGDPPESKYTILVAEDYDSNYMLIKSVLAGKYNLLRAVNGEEAIRMMDEFRPDLILMDIKMDGMDGIEATRVIRQKFKEVPIVMQTAYAFEYDRQASREAGCTDFIVKPILPSALKEMIEKYLK